MIRIIGVDPGSRITGYGIIDSDGTDSVYVAHGHIKAIDGLFADRLVEIHVALKAVVVQWCPETGAMEEAFVGNNAQSALKLGQARGAAIIALKSTDMPVFGYAPRVIKQAVTGNGGSDKTIVKKWVRAMLNIDHELQSDAADALAIALCHAHSFKYNTMVTQAPRRKRLVRDRGLRFPTP